MSLPYLMGEFYSPNEKEVIISKLEKQLNLENVSMKGTRKHKTLLPKKLETSMDLTKAIFDAARNSQLACYIQYNVAEAKYVSYIPDISVVRSSEKVPFDKQDVLHRIQGTGKQFFLWTPDGEYFADTEQESREFIIEQYQRIKKTCYMYRVTDSVTWKTELRTQACESSYKLSDKPQVLVRYACTVQ